MNHIECAAEQAVWIGNETQVAHVVETCGRQGDLLLQRIQGDAEAELAKAPPELTLDQPGGRMVAAGAHGEHRAIGRGALVNDVLIVPDGCLVVHTDVPSARHAALALAPGVWRIRRERELGMDQVVRDIKD